MATYQITIEDVDGGVQTTSEIVEGVDDETTNATKVTSLLLQVVANIAEQSKANKEASDADEAA